MKRKRDSPTREAVVTDLCGEGDRAYAVTRPKKKGRGETSKESITFSLKKWHGKVPPQEGQLVILEEVQRFAGGLRAESARPA